MIDWSKYPLCSGRRWSPAWRNELDRIITDIRCAERERCRSKALQCAEYFDDRSHDVENRSCLERADDLVRATACGHVAAAIEALGDED